MASAPAWKRLHRIASQLEPPPETLPYWIDHVDRGHRAPGWYWRPAGVQHAAYLGFNHVMAEISLLEQLDRQAAA